MYVQMRMNFNYIILSKNNSKLIIFKNNNNCCNNLVLFMIFLKIWGLLLTFQAFAENFDFLAPLPVMNILRQ